MRLTVNSTYAPMEYRDPATNELVGLDIDLANELAKRLGVKIVWSETPFAELIPSLQTKRADFIISGISDRSLAARDRRFHRLSGDRSAVLRDGGECGEGSPPISAARRSAPRAAPAFRSRSRNGASRIARRPASLPCNTSRARTRSTSATSSSRAASTPRCRAARRCPTRKAQEAGKYRVVGEPFSTGYQGIMFRKDDTALREVVTETSRCDDRRRLLQGHSRQMGTGRERGGPAHDECVHAMRAGADTRGGFSRSVGDAVARRAALVAMARARPLILVVLAAIGRAFANGQIEWSYVGRFLTAKVILEGIVNTMVMAVLAMALGIVLGVVVAIMRLSPNPVLAVGRGRLHLAVPRHAADPATAVVVQPRAGVSDHRHSRPVVGAGGRRHDAVPGRAARARHQPGRLHVRGDARRHAVGRHRTV